jgi:hypothetical protein
MNGGNREGGNLFERLQLSETGRGIAYALKRYAEAGNGRIMRQRRRTPPPRLNRFRLLLTAAPRTLESARGAETS